MNVPSFIIVATAILLSGPMALADEACDNGLDSFGRCAERDRVEWCTDDGTLYSAECGPGAICAPSSTGQGYTCIDRAETECADIPDSGSCPSLEVVVYCVNGVAKSFPCEGDNECGWSSSAGSYDCVAKGTLVGDAGPEAAPETAPDTPPTDAATSADLSVTPGGPGPTVAPGPSSLPEPPSDCSGGAAGAPWWLAISVLAMWRSRRTKRNNPTLA